MVGLLRLWNDWEVQILVLVSFMLQVFLLLFAGRRRRNITPVPRTLLWLAYLLADSIAIYILGHMSLSGKSHGHQQLVAVWAPILLMHLGGQDTITAYALEDNQLWPRHLLSLFVQAVGVAYVLYKYMYISQTLVTSAVLIFIAGVLKYGERVWALKSANLDNFSNYLDSTKLREATPGQDGLYCPRAQWVEQDVLGAEEVLEGAHDLFPICMGQFVDYKFWPSFLQSKAIKLFYDKGRMYELIELQLSLMYDVLYTKAAVIHTWYGCFIRAVSLVATIVTLFLFQSSIGKHDFNRVDAVVTYILVAGALLLEMTAVLRAMGSTWTCALLRSKRWGRLHSIAVSVRRCVRAAERNRRWSGSIGQHNLLLEPEDLCAECTDDLPFCLQDDFWDKLNPSLPSISKGIKELVLKEMLRMVEACEGKEEIMRSYSGQCVLKPYGAFLEDLTSSTGSDFDEKILTWHFATEILISCSEAKQDSARPLVDAIEKLSRYMVFLLVERPYMLPSPVRHRLYGNVHADLSSCHVAHIELSTEQPRKGPRDSKASSAFVRGEKLVRKLLDMEERGMPEVLQIVLGVWVEMLSYAGHHCSTDSHARQLNSGVEFITIVWLLSTAIFNHRYCHEDWFKELVGKFFTPHDDKELGCLHRFYRQCCCLLFLFVCFISQSRTKGSTRSPDV